MTESTTVPNSADIAEVQTFAVVIRADGTTENLGQVAYWHKNPLRRALNKIRKAFNG